MPDNTLTQKNRKKKSGIIFVIVVILGFAFVSKQEAVNTIDCTPEIIKQKPDVIMLGAWWCSYCYQAKIYFQKNKVHYCEYDMENTAEGKRLYKENGGGAVPLLLIGDYQLRGFEPEQIEQAIALLPHNTSPKTEQ